jgi:hypothetical protein
MKCLVLALLGPGAISDESRTRHRIRRVLVWDRIDILDWLRLLTERPMHGSDLAAWVWFRRCDEENVEPEIDLHPSYNSKEYTHSACVGLDVASWLRAMAQGDFIRPIAIDDSHPYIFPTGEGPIVIREQSPDDTTPDDRPSDAALKEPLRWTWRIRMPREEAKQLWLDGTLHVQLSPWEERRADRERWHARYRRSRRLLPSAATITT